MAEAYQSLYRRYRSKRFDEVKGQDHVVRALTTAVSEDRVGHAYLFSGPRGTGKTSTARILAKVLNCDTPKGGEPCGVCPNCEAVDQGRIVDWLLELDAASNNGVANIRELIERIPLGTSGNRKVVILDEVHMLSTGAANALLKSLEEPPAHVVFILATTDPQKVLPTIRSRTQHFEFHLLPADVLADHVRHVIQDANLGLGEDAVDHVVRQGGGSARDTLSALDQVSAMGGVVEQVQPVEAILEALVAHDAGAALVAVAAATDAGRDPRALGEVLIGALRDAFLAAMGAPDRHLPPGDAERAATLGAALGPGGAHPVPRGLGRGPGGAGQEARPPHRPRGRPRAAVPSRRRSVARCRGRSPRAPRAALWPPVPPWPPRLPRPPRRRSRIDVGADVRRSRRSIRREGRPRIEAWRTGRRGPGRVGQGLRHPPPGHQGHGAEGGPRGAAGGGHCVSRSPCAARRPRGRCSGDARGRRGSARPGRARAGVGRCGPRRRCLAAPRPSSAPAGGSTPTAAPRCSPLPTPRHGTTARRSAARSSRRWPPTSGARYPCASSPTPTSVLPPHRAAHRTPTTAVDAADETEEAIDVRELEDAPDAGHRRPAARRGLPRAPSWSTRTSDDGTDRVGPGPTLRPWPTTPLPMRTTPVRASPASPTSIPTT